MRNRLLHKGLSLLMAAGLLLSLSVPEALAAPEAGEAREEIAISSVEDLLAFSQNCALDDWSRGKTFVLTADLALSGTSFVPFPIFAACGTTPQAPARGCSATWRRGPWCGICM